MTYTKNKDLAPRSQRKQARSKQRAEEIMRATAALLDEVGFDDLTTILIAKDLGISVGSLYHYFPNKQSILRALANDWLEDWNVAMQSVVELPVESMSIKKFCTSVTAILQQVYLHQRGLLPLVQAMYAVPELRDLDEQHDKLLVTRMTSVLRRLKMNVKGGELSRIATLYLEISHNLLIEALSQKDIFAERTVNDLNALCVSLLKRYR